MSKGSAAYDHDRAEVEILLARNARHPAAAKAHYHLAGRYLARFHGADDEESGQPSESDGNGFGNGFILLWD